MNMMPKFLNSKTQHKIYEYICAYFYRGNLVLLVFSDSVSLLDCKGTDTHPLDKIFDTLKMTVDVKKSTESLSKPKVIPKTICDSN